MAILVTKCPHCATESVSLELLAVQAWDESNRNGEPVCSALFRCPVCSKPIAATLKRFGGNITSRATLVEYAGQLMKFSGRIQMQDFTVQEQYPETAINRVPGFLPPTASTSLESAENLFRQPGNEEAAAMMYRRALERALKEKFPVGRGMLGTRIRALVKSGVLHPALGRWANKVRELGNKGAHDAAVTRDDLVALREFTDAVLRYGISLPAEIEQRERATDPDAEDDAPEPQ